MDPKESEIRALLRERFLRLMNSVSGQRATIKMYEKTRVEATFMHCDVAFDHILVGDLDSPIGRLPRAVLRTSDIVTVDLTMSNAGGYLRSGLIDRSPVENILHSIIWHNWRMDDIKEIRYHIDSIFRILQQFRHLSDAYVIEYFTTDLWSKLSPSWCELFDSIDLRTVGELLDLQRPFKPTRVVPPLNLLALRRCCQTYSLRRTPMITYSEMLGRFRALTPEGSGIPGSHPPPCALFHMSPKKRHEISRLSELIDVLIAWRKDQISDDPSGFSVLDVGSGCGHLARYLSLVKGLNTTTVEAQSYFIDRAKLFDRKTAYRLDKWKGNGFVFPIHRNEFFRDSSASIDQAPEDQRMVWLLGLHTCGDLAPLILRSFANDPTAELIVSISCCYMKLTTSVDHVDAENVAYPLSSFLKSSTGPQLTYAAREMACHALEQYSSKLIASDDSSLEALKVHSYRAALEVVIRSKYPDRKREQIRSVKNAHRITLKEYAKLALSRLDSIDLDALLEENVIDFWAERIKNEWKRVVAFYSVRLLLAPLIESVILLDRLLYLKELGYKESWIAPIFDPNISARNLMLIAVKDTL